MRYPSSMGSSNNLGPCSTTDQPANSDAQELISTLSLLAVLTTLTSLAVLALCAWLRSGLAQPLELLILAFLQLAATVTSPIVFVRLGMLRNASLLGLPPMAVLLLPLLGFFLPYWLLASTLALLALVGLGLAIQALRFSAAGVISVLICAIALAVWSVIHYNADLDLPILAPELALTGDLRSDGYYHAALTHFIMQNGFPSTGVDGLKSLLLYDTGAYHWLAGLAKVSGNAHYWIAGLAKVSGTPPLLALPIVAEALTIPLALFALGFVVAVQAPSSARLQGLAVVLSISGFVIFGRFGWNYLSSPNVLLAMVFFFLALPTLHSIFTASHISRREVWVASVLPVLFALINASLAVMWIVSLVYAGIRRSSWSPRAQLTLIALLGLAFIANPPFFYFTYHDDYDPLSPDLLPLAVPVLLVAVMLIENRVTTWDKLSALVVGRCCLATEVVVVLVVASLVIALVGTFPPSAPYWLILLTAWFAWPPLVIALVRLTRPYQTAHWPQTIPHDPPDKVFPLGRRIPSPELATLAIIVVVALGALVLSVSTLSQKLFLDQFYWQRSAVSLKLNLPPVSRTHFVRDTLRRGHLFPPELGCAMSRSVGQRFANDIRRLSSDQSSGVAVFVPPENDTFWSLVDHCEVKPLFIPAVVGLPMLLGMPPKSMTECVSKMSRYGHRWHYGDAHTRAMSRADLCDDARKRNIRAVIVLGKRRSELVSCP